MSLLDGYFGLSEDLNKVNSFTDAGTGELLPELTLDMSDDELIDLQQSWMKQWAPYKGVIEKKQTENENYWLGAQFAPATSGRAVVDNLIFESLETFLPIATRPKADPLVESDNTEEGNALADRVRKMLAFQADRVSYNLELKQVVRYWALYMLGVMKVGWSVKENDLTCVSIRPQKLILDPTATVSKGEYTGYYIGEMMEDIASVLVLRFPAKKALISDKVHTNMGTKLEYTMWTTDDYVFWTLGNEVLAKTKNPHWNYDTTTTTTVYDDDGAPLQQEQGVPGKNHFRNRKKPYVFLSIFNLGKQPMDDANLVQQNIPLQDLINKRLLQIDRNADSANGGLIVSGDAFTEEQAGKAAKALRDGGTIWVPTGNVNEAVRRDSGTPLPNFVYESLTDYRGELRNIFGIRGSSPQGLSGERTVRGKMFMQQQDQARIGGGISIYLEQFSDSVYNWFMQLMYVYYDEPHTASVLGKERAQEYIELVNSDFSSRLTIGVKEGSMIAHDPATQREEAMTLWAQKGIDPITFFDRLDFPNPREAAKNLYLWMSDPVSLFPDLQQQQQAQQQQQMATMQQMQQQQTGQEQQGQAQLADQAQVHKLQQMHVDNLMNPPQPPNNPPK